MNNRRKRKKAVQESRVDLARAPVATSSRPSSAMSPSRSTKPSRWFWGEIFGELLVGRSFSSRWSPVQYLWLLLTRLRVKEGRRRTRMKRRTAMTRRWRRRGIQAPSQCLRWRRRCSGRRKSPLPPSHAPTNRLSLSNWAPSRFVPERTLEDTFIMNLTPTLDIFVAVLKKSGDSYKSHQQPNRIYFAVTRTHTIQGRRWLLLIGQRSRRLKSHLEMQDWETWSVGGANLVRLFRAWSPSWLLIS